MPCYDHTTQLSNINKLHNLLMLRMVHDVTYSTKMFLYQILMSVLRVMVVVLTPVEIHLDPLLVAVDLDTRCKMTAGPVQVTNHATP